VTKGDETVGAPEQAVPDLRQIYFYLTEGCNCACRHCWLAPKLDPTASKTDVLPLETFEAVIAEAKPLGLQAVKLTGGEPLMHPQILDILGVVRRERLSLSIETNGMQCTPEVAEAIAACEDRFVAVSVDGVDAATHDYVRNLPGAYDRALAGIAAIESAGIAPQIIMSVMRCNVDQIDDLVHWAENAGAESVKFNIVQPTARGRALSDGADGLAVEEYIEIGRRVERDLVPHVRIPLHYSYPAAFQSLSRLAAEGGGGTCGIKGLIGVIATGEYALCGVGQHAPELVFGVAGRDPLATLWSHDAVLQSLRDGLPDQLEGVCSRCVMRYRCLGSCVAQNYYRSRNLLAPFWFCEQAEEKGLFPQSRKIV
jgi:SynChlorMet cassette radical SAM/SPASM protein ScmF